MPTIGDGVIYHGSQVQYHGLYVIVGDDRPAGRFVLADPGDPESVLYHVRVTSFDVLLPAGILAGDDDA